MDEYTPCSSTLMQIFKVEPDSADGRRLKRIISYTEIDNDEDSSSIDGAPVEQEESSGTDDENGNVRCRGEEIPQIYEDRLGFIKRRHAGYYPDFHRL